VTGAIPAGDLVDLESTAEGVSAVEDILAKSAIEVGAVEIHGLGLFDQI
jgi:hypothetical protein